MHLTGMRYDNDHMWCLLPGMFFPAVQRTHVVHTGCARSAGCSAHRVWSCSSNKVAVRQTELISCINSQLFELPLVLRYPAMLTAILLHPELLTAAAAAVCAPAMHSCRQRHCSAHSLLLMLISDAQLAAACEFEMTGFALGWLVLLCSWLACLPACRCNRTTSRSKCIVMYLDVAVSWRAARLTAWNLPPK